MTERRFYEFTPLEWRRILGEQALTSKEQDLGSPEIGGETLWSRSFTLSLVLTDRQREVIGLRFGLSGEKPMTQTATARKLNISRSTVRTHEKRVFENISDARLAEWIVDLANR